MEKVYLAVFGIVALLSIVSSISALQIAVNVDERLATEIKSLTWGNPDGMPAKINTEIYNPGSVGYQARVRIDIMNDSMLIGSVWSGKQVLMPGDRKSLELYWYLPNVTGNLSLKSRVYYGNEITEGSSYQMQIIPSAARDVFDVKNFRTYDGYVRFLVKSSEATGNVVFIPAGYTKGWIFEQAKTGPLDNKSREITINYEPAVWNDGQKMTLLIVSEDGKLLSVKQFDLKLETGLQKYVDMVLDRFDAYFG